MRKKLFYTADEISNNLYTTGSLLMYEDGTNYIGLYHLYTTGETYTGGKWSSKQSIKLIPYVERDTPINTVYNSLKSINISTKPVSKYQPMITESDKQSGFIIRYFLKKVNEQLILEVSDKTYKNWKQGSIDNKMYIGIQLNWYITGDIEDKYDGPTLIRGVISQNNRQIKAAKFTISDIDNILNNPLELYNDIDYIVPKDINNSAI